ncbi:MAG: PepSY domain-containing protein [Deltaproteobacteria bacterium]|nr:PepSY domain-containing protein [Deltaproteobacteria bacterium]
MKITGTIFSISKRLHKYIGLFFLLYFILMGITGIILNHPEMFSPFSAPLYLMPESYRYAAFNRLAMRDVAFSIDLKDTHYIGGKEGVWQSMDNGRRYLCINNGLPLQSGKRDTNCLLTDKGHKETLIFAGTGDGLYFCEEGILKWQKASFIDKAPDDHGIIDLIKTSNGILAFTQHACYRIDNIDGKPVLKPLNIPIDFEPQEKAPLYKLLFKIHDGAFMGLAGRLIIDAATLVMIFLCISSIYMWYMPWRKRHSRQGYRGNLAMFRFFNRYHLKLGIYSALFIAVIAITGMFMRPPLLVAIIKHTVPARWIEQGPNADQLPITIEKAAYNPEDDSIIIAASDSLFIKGPADFAQPFKPVQINVPVHGMGVNTLKWLNKSRLLTGSFSGFYIWDDINKSVSDIKGNPIKKVKRGMTGIYGMSAGAAVEDGELRFLADYDTGIINVSSNISPLMPDKLREEGRISMFNLIFEIHNGRIFRDLLGSYTWLIVPLGGLLLFLTAFTGVYDWLYRKI